MVTKEKLIETIDGLWEDYFDLIEERKRYIEGSYFSQEERNSNLNLQCKTAYAILEEINVLNYICYGYKVKMR